MMKAMGFKEDNGFFLMSEVDSEMLQRI